jgi:hypothetical protein
MSKLKLNNVRLAFPSLFHKAKFDGKDTKYEGTLLIDKSDTKTIEAIEAEMEKVRKAAKIKVRPDKFALKDGDVVEYDGYAGCMSLKAANKKRPTLVDKNRSPVTEEDDILYAGCYVNAIVDFWAQDNSFGKRINSNLLAVQFAADGEPFGGGGSVASPDEFDDVSDDFDMDDVDDF